jgi:type I restriction-modification system DNA methylase subunit
LPKDYARPVLDKERLGQIIDLISNIQIGDEASRAKDVLGRIYEYFLSQFASAETQEDDGEPFDEKMRRLTAQWRVQVAEAQQLDAAIEKNTQELGYGEQGGLIN